MPYHSGLSSSTRSHSVFNDPCGAHDRHRRLRVPTAVPSIAPSNQDGPGVLVLSEFAGSAQSLSGALRVNPWNTEEVATTIHEALNLSRVERELRQHKLYRYVTTHTASYWARSYFAEFLEVRRKRVRRCCVRAAVARSAISGS